MLAGNRPSAPTKLAHTQRRPKNRLSLAETARRRYNLRTPFKEMPEFRQDPWTGRMVIIAEERAERPHQFDIADTAPQNNDTLGLTQQDVCPFCEGNESLTPPEMTAFRRADSKPNTPGWTVRVVPNKYPAVRPGDIPPVFTDPSVADSVGDMPYVAEGVGLHEVIIDTPRHCLSVSELTTAEMIDMLAMYRQRLATLRNDRRWHFVQIFKNVGVASGASLPHSHSQLIALPFLPTASVLKETPHCLWCQRLKNERKTGERIVEETENFVVLCPFVSRFAGEIELYPKYHESGFDRLDDSMGRELAEIFRRTIIRLEGAVFWMKNPLSYNIILKTEPLQYDQRLDQATRPFFHWHFSILPSLARAAGFEWGTGLHINPISPEQAAKRLRAVM